MNIITLQPSATATITMYGYFYDKLNTVYLSAPDSSVFPYVCAVDLFSNSAKLSAAFPRFYGYPWQSYSIVNQNILNIAVYALSANTFYDIILTNNAGYSKLSDTNYILDSHMPPTPGPVT